MAYRRWLVPAVVAVVRHPELYGTALVQLRRLASPGWWRHAPFLPLPTERYLRFRLVTMYGGTGDDGFEPDDLVTYLRWCKHQRHRRVLARAVGRNDR